MKVKKKTATRRKAASRAHQDGNYDPTDRRAFLKGVARRNQGQPEFLQAVEEVAYDVFDYIGEQPKFSAKLVFERMTEPDRVLIFSVAWEDDEGNTRINRGYRVQFNNALGPYKGGLRFHPSVNLSIIKFLAFEQTLKNALTTLPLGSAKGGSDFNPHGKSDGEVLRFCKSFMLGLHRYIGPNLDVPAGDIGVGSREVGYLFGQYKRLTGEHAGGTITGKGIEYGGSLIRAEATGFGTVYFAVRMLEHHNLDIRGKTCLVSGAGNVALHCALKLAQLGARPVTLSDSSGFIHDPDGLDEEKIAAIKELKEVRRGRISEYARSRRRVSFHAGARPWGVKADLAFPCATQNELEGKDARTLLANGCIGVVEGANMPCTAEAQTLLRKKVLFGPAKAANAGGVAVSGLEMTQNSMHYHWNEQELDAKLQDIMTSIHGQCLEYGRRGRKTDYVRGANIAGFVRVGRAMIAYGV
ncbi:MAG: NADP-specific glutamate dehydrogenase [Betaproteobacteria bacterium]|nr:NADP-specific glutamate dehydrogenase [Betaproteobacteria bacterium]